MSRKAKYTHFFSREDIKKALADRSEELLKVVPGSVLVFLVDQLTQFVPPEDYCDPGGYEDWFGIRDWDLNIWYNWGVDTWYATLYHYSDGLSKSPTLRVTMIL